MERDKGLKQLSDDMKNRLEEIGKKLGFKSEKEWKVEGGRIDLVWYLDSSLKLPKIDSNKIPVVGFEIESSWRTRKHIKGDIFNLLSLSPAYGIILYLKGGFSNEKGDRESAFQGNVDATIRFASGFKGLSKISVWTEDDIKDIEGRISEGA